MINKNIIINRLKEIAQKVENNEVNSVIPMMLDLESLMLCEDTQHKHGD